jgi:hypothetical protein
MSSNAARNVVKAGSKSKRSRNFFAAYVSEDPLLERLVLASFFASLGNAGCLRHSIMSRQEPDQFLRAV